MIEFICSNRLEKIETYRKVKKVSQVSIHYYSDEIDEIMFSIFLGLLCLVPCLEPFGQDPAVLWEEQGPWRPPGSDLKSFGWLTAME